MSIDIDTADEVELPRFATRPIHHRPLPPGLEGFALFPNLRSTHHRRNMGIDGYSREDLYATISNPTPFDFYWSGSGRFMHFLVGCSPESEQASLAHAAPLTNDEEVRRMLGEGHISFEDRSEPVIQDGFLVLHSSDRAYLAKRVGEIQSVRVDVGVTKPDTIREGDVLGLKDSATKFAASQGIYVPTREIVKLSEHTGMQVFYQDSALPSLMRYAGFVDPGFQGDLGYQPVLRQGIEISANQPLLFGRILFSEEPVEKDYSRIPTAKYKGSRLNGKT